MLKSTKNQNTVINVSCTQATHGCRQFSSIDNPAADTGVIQLGGVKIARSILAPSHEEHLELEEDYANSSFYFLGGL